MCPRGRASARWPCCGEGIAREKANRYRSWPRRYVSRGSGLLCEKNKPAGLIGPCGREQPLGLVGLLELAAWAELEDDEMGPSWAYCTWALPLGQIEPDFELKTHGPWAQ